MEKKAKEFHIGDCDGFNVSYGTVNKTNPSVFYVSGKTWVVTPELDDPQGVSESFTSCVRESLKVALNKIPNLENRFILDFDVRPESFVCGKRKCFSFEVFLVQSDDVSPIDQMSDEAHVVGSAISSRLRGELERYGFSSVSSHV